MIKRKTADRPGSARKSRGKKRLPQRGKATGKRTLPESYLTLAKHFTLGVYRSTPGPTGRFLQVNPALVKMLGCRSQSELLSQPIDSFYQNPADRRKFSERLSRLGVVHNEELALRRKDGTPIVVSEIAVACRDRKGKVLCFEGFVEDITDRKRSESQFDLQNAYLDKLFNAAPEAIVLHNNQDRIVDVNDEFTRLFGYTREESVGRQINELVAPDELREEAADVSRRVIHGERVELESRRKRKDGVLIDVSILGAPIFHRGKQVGDYAIYRDISERKKTEERLRIQRTYLEGLLNSAPEAIVFHDVNDVVVTVNDEFLRMFGYSRDEVIGKPVNSLVAPDNLEGEAAQLSNSVVHGHRVELETKRRRKDGTVFDVSILGAPIFHEGKQAGVYAIYRDISERKKAEEEILIQKSFFERLFNSAPEAILLHDNADRVVSVNEEFVRMFGYSAEEAIGRTVNDLVAPAELMEEALRLSAMSHRGERVEAETRRRRKDGTLLDVSVLGAPVVHEGKQIAVYGIYRDITEHKKEQEALSREKEESRLARNIQIQFLPKSNPEVPGYDIAGKSLPAMIVGGDYYDFIQLDDDRVAIGLGDVSGKGLAASLVMASLQATIRSEALHGSDPALCLTRANTLLFGSTDARTFVSVFYGILDRRENTLTYANAGQGPVVLYAKGKPPAILPGRSIALALTHDSRYEDQIISLQPGDALVVCSDGLSEAMNDRMEEFGVNRIMDLVLRNRERPAVDLLDTLFEAVHQYGNSRSQQDDMTAVLLRRLV